MSVPSDMVAERGSFVAMSSTDPSAAAAGPGGPPIGVDGDSDLEENPTTTRPGSDPISAQGMFDMFRTMMQAMQNDNRVFLEKSFGALAQQMGGAAGVGGRAAAQPSAVDLDAGTKSATRRLLEKLEREPLCDKRAFQKLPNLTKPEEEYDGWKFKLRGFLDQEPIIKQYLDVLEDEVLLSSNVNKMVTQMDMYKHSQWDGDDDDEDSALMRVISNQLYTCLQQLVFGGSAAMLQNLEKQGDSRGFEAWAK